jgi:hypothetical protein
MGNTIIHELSPRTIIVITKLVYADHQNTIIDLDDVNKSIRKLGISTDLNLDISFIYEVIRMNDERFENNTISPENLILPEKQSVNIEYYKTFSEFKKYMDEHRLDQEKIQEYLKSQRKFPMPVIEYKGGQMMDQEGHHRAVVAKLKGINEIPVMIVNDINIDNQKIL